MDPPFPTLSNLYPEEREQKKKEEKKRKRATTTLAAELWQCCIPQRNLPFMLLAQNGCSVSVEDMSDVTPRRYSRFIFPQLHMLRSDCLPHPFLHFFFCPSHFFFSPSKNKKAHGYTSGPPTPTPFRCGLPYAAEYANNSPSLQHVSLPQPRRHMLRLFFFFKE